MSWFNNPYTFESQEITRVQKREEEIAIMRAYRLNMECKEKARTIEKLIIKRCLPAPYHKDVGISTHMYVTEMDDELWQAFIGNQQVPPTINKRYKHSYPDHGHYRTEEFQRVGWCNGDHPCLITPHWYLTKWYQNGIVYKAFVYSVDFIRNSFSGLVRCEYNYFTWFYDVQANGWRFC